LQQHGDTYLPLSDETMKNGGKDIDIVAVHEE
jgi:hypothetical protein